MIRFEGISKRFRSLRGPVDAVADVNLTIEDGEFFVLLGPSGCGKSTLLNLVAGLERPTDGVLRFGERVVAAPRQRIFLPPGERDVAMVFQSYALYPHLDVWHNIAFPLRVARRPRAEVRAAVERTAALLGIADLLERRPAELSGGQRQRVAIARALVRRPAVFLLDEPLSNLDAQLRTSTRTELKRLQRAVGVTTLYVTHDQTEAMTLGDRVALLRGGRVVQVDPPTALYDAPATPFAATFVGSPPMNLLPARLEDPAAGRIVVAGVALTVPRERLGRAPTGGGPVLLGVRPEALTVLPADGAAAGGGAAAADGPAAAGAPALPGRVTTIEPLGREALVHVAVGDLEVLALVPAVPFGEGAAVRVGFPPERAHVYPAAGPDPDRAEDEA